MKKTIRLLLGLLSSLLLAVGFVSAANRIDPLTSATSDAAGFALRPGTPCNEQCADISDVASLTLRPTSPCNEQCADISDVA